MIRVQAAPAWSGQRTGPIVQRDGFPRLEIGQLALTCDGVSLCALVRITSKDEFEIVL